MQQLIRAAVAWGSMAFARRLRKGGDCGVIVTGHLLSRRDTRRQVDVLSRWFEFIHHDDLLERLARPRKRPFCLLTFDDGKRMIAEETAPELARLGVPAVFYVPTRFLTERFPLWFDRHQAIGRLLGYVPPELEIEALKQLPLALIDERLDRICARHEMRLDLESADVRPMSWDDARALARCGFTVGAHGMYHRILTREPEGEALDEIRGSIDEVTREMGAQCATFAFPNGNYTRRLAEHALACGVRTVMTTDPVWVDPESPRWRLPRIELLGRDGAVKIACKLAAAATGRVLMNPDGTGRLYARRMKVASR